MSIAAIASRTAGTGTEGRFDRPTALPASRSLVPVEAGPARPGVATSARSVTPDAALGVRLLGAASSEEVLAALHRADAALAPSVTAADGDQDGPVNTLKEAMATGLPVIGTRHGGIPELVEQGVSGLLVPERDAEALARAIAHLMDAPGDWRRLGAAGRQKVVDRYDRKSILRATLGAYARALGQDGDPP